MEETIELKEIIDTIWKGKWIIAAVTAIAVLVAAFASFFILDPVYSAKAMVSVKSVNVNGDVSSEMDSYINDVVTPAGYTERIQSPEVLNQAIEKTGLETYTYEEVQHSLTLGNPAGTNIINLEFRAADQTEAQNLLASIMESVKTSYLTEIIGRMEEDKSEYAAQAAAEKEKLDTMLKEYRGMAEELNLPSSFLLDAAVSYNNSYIFDTNLDGLQNTGSISEAQLVALNELSSEVNTVSGVYQDFNNRARQLESFAEIFSIDSKISTVSAPLAADEPVSPNTLLNIAISLVIGLMAGVGIVFFREYWKNSGPKEEEVETAG